MDFAVCTLIALAATLEIALRRSDAQVPQPLVIQVYYETLCPDSRNFIVKELNYAHKIFGSQLGIEFIPFGKASHNNQGGFTCQHGPPECLGNMVDNCVLKRLPPGESQVKYVVCRMNASAGRSKAVDECIENSGVSVMDVMDCVNSNEGYALMEIAEQKTRNNTPGPEFVPTVTFNDRYCPECQSAVESGKTMYILCNMFQLCESSHNLAYSMY